jgi:hypothetical protein
MKLAADGSLSGEVVEKLYGDIAADTRVTFSKRDEHQRSELIDWYVGRDLNGVTLKDVKWENMPEVDKELVLSYSVTASAYAKAMGPMLMVRPRVLGSDAVEVDEKKRVYPVNLGETMLKQDEFEMELPAGYVVDELPEPVKMDVEFAGYESQAKVEGNTLHYIRTYTVREVEVPAAKYEDLRKLMGTIRNDERSSVVLRRAQ